MYSLTKFYNLNDANLLRNVGPTFHGNTPLHFKRFDFFKCIKNLIYLLHFGINVGKKLFSHFYFTKKILEKVFLEKKFLGNNFIQEKCFRKNYRQPQYEYLA